MRTLAMWTARPRTYRRTMQRGQAMAELALVLPIVILVLLGIFDMGRYVAAVNTTSNAVRQAARAAVVKGYPACAGTGSREACAQKVAEMALGSSGFPTPVVTVTCVPVNCKLGALLEVRATVDFHLITPVISSLVSNTSIDLSTVMAVES